MPTHNSVWNPPPSGVGRFKSALQQLRAEQNRIRMSTTAEAARLLEELRDALLTSPPFAAPRILPV